MPGRDAVVSSRTFGGNVSTAHFSRGSSGRVGAWRQAQVAAGAEHGGVPRFHPSCITTRTLSFCLVSCADVRALRTRAGGGDAEPRPPRWGWQKAFRRCCLWNQGGTAAPVAQVRQSCPIIQALISSTQLKINGEKGDCWRLRGDKRHINPRPKSF